MLHQPEEHVSVLAHHRLHGREVGVGLLRADLTAFGDGAVEESALPLHTGTDEVELIGDPAPFRRIV